MSMQKRMGFKRKILVGAVATSSLILAQAPGALAQGASALEEVVVTANAREQNVTDIPYNISAIQGEDIAARQIFTETELLRSVPGVYAVDKGQRNAGIMNMITIRGLQTNTLSNGDMAYNSAPTVSTYVNNTPMFANFLLKDINRVEVLRGPQGTLYGSGSLGGTVRYLMNRPSTEGFEAEVDARYSQTEGSDGDNVGVDAMINIPMGDKFAIRFSGSIVDNDGYTDYERLYVLNPDGSPAADPCFDGDCSSTGVDDRSMGGPIYRSEEDADTVEVDYARIALLWEPTDNLSFNLNYQNQSDEIGARSGSTPALADDGTSFGDLVSGRPQVEPSERDVELVALDIEWDLGFATLTSNTSSYETDGEGISDNTGFYAKVGWGGAYMVQPRPMNVATRGYSDEGFTQEFRLVSNGGNFIDWTAGIFYADQEYEAYQDSTLPGWLDWADDTMIDSNP
ncbi:MAG: TonB-dependent receptor plug domain-containing protein, partial [Halieaceae bacterium]|nr:TonB-dependent receptor plug domain-containing protein [Halieaceae bacterium]